MTPIMRLRSAWRNGSDVKARAVEIPRLLEVGSGCLASVADVLAEANFDLKHVLVGSGSGPSSEWGDRVVESLGPVSDEVTRVDGLSGRLDQAAQMAAVVIEQGVTLLVAVGGGRVIDVVKL